MTYREPYSNPLTPVYQWSYAPNGWLRSSVVNVDPFRRYILKLQAEALVRRVPLVLVYHGQVRGDAGPLKEDTTERRALEEGRQIVRWQDNSNHFQPRNPTSLGNRFASVIGGRVHGKTSVG